MSASTSEAPKLQENTKEKSQELKFEVKSEDDDNVKKSHSHHHRRLPHYHFHPVHIDTGLFTKNSLIQLGYGFWVNLKMVLIGLAFGFSAIALPQLEEPDSLIKITLSDRAWITSVLTLLTPVGSILSGYILDRWGRRILFNVFCVPTIIGWLVCGFASTAKHLIIGRMIIGFGIGIMAGASRVYCVEICLPNMRGLVGAIPNVLLSAGLVAQATLGHLFKWRSICFYCAMFAILLAISFVFLPETPYYTIMKSHNVILAEKSLRKFRSKDYTHIEHELKQLVDFQKENNIRRLSFSQELRALFTLPACRVFFIVMTYSFMCQMSGITVITFYAVEILKDSKSSIDPGIGNIMLNLTRLCSSFLAVFLCYTVRRKRLAIFSSYGMAVACTCAALYIMYVQTPTIAPQLFYMLYVCSATCGAYILPMLIMYELYPLQIRGLLGGITISVLFLFIFASNNMFPYMKYYIGLQFVLLWYAAWCILCVLFVFKFVPETKNVTLQEIEEYFNGRRSTLAPTRELAAAQNKMLVRGSATSVTSAKKPMKSPSKPFPKKPPKRDKARQAVIII